MRAVLRIGRFWLAASLALAPAMALAQEASPTSNSAASQTIGPRELKDFSLGGPTTHATQPTPATNAAPAPSADSASVESDLPQAGQAEPAVAVTSPQVARTTSPRRSATTATAVEAQSKLQARTQAAQQLPPSPTIALPPAAADHSSAAEAALPQPSANTSFPPAPQSGLAANPALPFLPWLLAALVLAAAAAFLLRRKHSRQAFAGGPRIDAFTAPQPARAPRPAPPLPPKTPLPAPPAAGIVSTRLRPSLDLHFEPLRCVVHDDRVVVEFVAELINSGNAPARAVIAEAALFSAGPDQQSEIAAFFQKPAPVVPPIDEIPPLQRVSIRAEVAAPLGSLRALEAGGRRVFVPLVSLKAHYRWNASEGQTSAAFLVGRDVKAEKLAPFRLDLGPRVFRGLAARLLPGDVKR